MTTNQIKSRAPDLFPTPEEPMEFEGDDKSRGAAFSRSRSGLNLHLQERLLSCGNFSALLDDEDRMGRRPSIGSLSVVVLSRAATVVEEPLKASARICSATEKELYRWCRWRRKR